MLPLLSSHYPWWFGLYKKTKMVDFHMKIEDWLQETSLFGDELIDSININDFLSSEKANSKGNQANLGDIGDLDWLDDGKVDISVFDNPNGLLDHCNDAKSLIEDDAAYLLGLLDSSFNPSHFDILDCEEINSCKQSVVEDLIAEPTSPEFANIHLASPRYNSLQVNSPVFCPVQSPASPYSDVSEENPEESLPNLASPATSDSTTDILDSPQVRVTVCDNVAASSSSEPVLSIEEVSRSVRKRKFVSDGESIPKIRVILCESPPSVSTRKPKNRQERKKVQNKEAAARYRVKKRKEDKVLSDEVACLESEQQKLQQKHDDLQSEIKYLKSLMCEMLIKKGVMK